MTEHKRPTRVRMQLPSPTTVYTLTRQLEGELDRSMRGTPEDRDAFLKNGGQQVPYLKLMLSTFIQAPEERERSLKQLHAMLRKQGKPENGATRADMLAAQLVQALYPYFTGSPSRRARLMNVCGRIFFQVYKHINILTTPDRELRERMVWFAVEIESKLPDTLLRAMKEAYRNRRRKRW